MTHKPLKILELSLNSPKCVNYKELHIVTETRWSGSNFRWVLEISYIWRACKSFDFWLRLIWARIGLLTLNSVCWEGFLVCFVSCFSFFWGTPFWVSTMFAADLECLMNMKVYILAIWGLPNGLTSSWTSVQPHFICRGLDHILKVAEVNDFSVAILRVHLVSTYFYM